MFHVFAQKGLISNLISEYLNGSGNFQKSFSRNASVFKVGTIIIFFNDSNKVVVSKVSLLKYNESHFPFHIFCQSNMSIWNHLYSEVPNPNRTDLITYFSNSRFVVGLFRLRTCRFGFKYISG